MLGTALLALAACGGGDDQRLRTDLAAAQVTSIGVNSYLWRASLETLSFMPLTQADSSGGVIVTDWYANPGKPGERVKVSVSILDQDLRADALRVAARRAGAAERHLGRRAGTGGHGAATGGHHPHQGPRPAPFRDRLKSAYGASP